MPATLACSWALILLLAVTQVHGTKLLALGDSICTGQLPSPKNQVFTSNSSYTNTLNAYLMEKNMTTEEPAKVCCPSEDSSEILNGTYAVPPSDASFCYSGAVPGLPPSQLQMALQAEDVELITISMGANDLFPCLEWNNVSEDMALCAATRTKQIISNMKTVLETLQQQVNGEPTIMVLSPYNPYLAYGLSDDPSDVALVVASADYLVTMTSSLVETVYEPMGILVVDANQLWANSSDICQFTGMCTYNNTSGKYQLADPTTRDIHPTPEGYQMLAKAHIELLESSMSVPDTTTAAVTTEAPSTAPADPPPLPTASPVFEATDATSSATVQASLVVSRLAFWTIISWLLWQQWR